MSENEEIGWRAVGGAEEAAQEEETAAPTEEEERKEELQHNPRSLIHRSLNKT